VLESVAAQKITGKLVKNHWKKLAFFIHPPFPFPITDALLTNFHLPRFNAADARQRIRRAGRNPGT